MQQILISLFLLTAWLAITTSPVQGQSPAPSSPQAQPIRKITITELDSYIRQCGHPLIVNYWATYCSPCLKEIPYLQSTVEKYRDSGVELLLVSLDPPADHARRIAAFAKKMNIVAKLAWLDET